MSEAAEKLKPVLLALSADERQELADLLWGSLAEPDEVLLAELERRRTEYEAGRRLQGSGP